MCPTHHGMGEEVLLVHCTMTFASLATTQHSPALSTANRSPSSIASASTISVSMELTGCAEISSTRPVESLPTTLAQEDLGLTLTSTLIFITCGSRGSQVRWMDSVHVLFVALYLSPTGHAFAATLTILTVSIENGSLSNTYLQRHFHTHHIKLAPATKISAFSPLAFSQRSTTKLISSPSAMSK